MLQCYTVRYCYTNSNSARLMYSSFLIRRCYYLNEKKNIDIVKENDVCTLLYNIHLKEKEIKINVIY